VDGRFFLGFHQLFTVNEKNEVVERVGNDGEPRDESSHLILLAYADRERIMNALIEGDTYQVLAKKNSRKVKYFTNDPACHIYDGKGVEFDSRVTIVEDPEQISALFDRLTETKNNYFNNNSGLVLLKFSK
jgi:DNA helicase IV